MPVYRYRAGNEEGLVVEKETKAESPEALRKQLEGAGWFVYEIKGQSLSLFRPFALIRPRKVKNSEFLVFNQEFSALLKAGLPIVTSLETLSEKEENLYFKEVLEIITKDVREGASLSDAMSSASPLFTNLYTSSIKAGEKSGDLVTNITRYVKYIKQLEELKKKIVGAAIYPVILLFVATFVIFFLLIYVVPSFSQIFMDSGTELPLPTVILISITRLLADNILLLGILFIASVAGFIVFKDKEKGRTILDKLKVSAPWAGDMIKKYAVAKFSRTLSTVLKSGSTLPAGLQLASATLGNIFLEEKLKDAIAKVKEGESLASSMEETGIIPSTALKMILVGESSGSLDTMFENVAELFEEEVDRKVNVITTTIEPLLMLGMGLIIAFIVVAMYLPIFRLAGTAG